VEKASGRQRQACVTDSLKPELGYHQGCGGKQVNQHPFHRTNRPQLAAESL